MPVSATQTDDSRVADNLRRTVELTELGLALRQAVLRQRDPHGTSMTQVMHEIRVAKEQAWRLSRTGPAIFTETSTTTTDAPLRQT